MSEVESRVSDLEDALMKLVYAQFNTEMALRQFIKKTEAFQDEMKEFKDEMQAFKDESREERTVFKEEMKAFRDGSLVERKAFMEEMKAFRDESLDERKAFKEEMQDFKDEMKTFKDETRSIHREMNKRWGDLANKMGTVVEDIVAPYIRRIARQYFGCSDLEFFAVRVDKRHPADPLRRREFDVVTVGGDLVFLNETKSTVRSSYVADCIDFVKNDEFFAYFPEYKGKRLIPLFASLSVPEDKVALLSKAHIYVMAMTDTTMDLVNFQLVEGNSSQ